MTAVPDLLPAISIAAAFATGVAGSGHCIGMCGGLAAAYGSKARRDVDLSSQHPAARAFLQVAIHHFGRLLGYALLGAVAGATGGLLFAALDLTRIAGILRLLSGILIIVMGLRLLVGLKGLRLLETGGARIWRYIAPIAHRLSSGSGLGSALGAGLFWGWLPCGLVYSMLALAATTGAAAAGAGTLLAFGAGTLPAMLTSGLLASQVTRLLRHRNMRAAAGLLLVASGVWTMLASSTHGISHGGVHPPALATHMHSEQ